VFNKDVYIAQGITTANAAYKKAFNKITSTTSLTSSKYDLAPGSNYRNLYTSMERAYKYSNCTVIGAEEQIDYQAADKFNITAGARFDSYNCIPQSTDLASPVDKNSYIHGTVLGTTAYYRPEGLEAEFFFVRYNNIGSYFQAQYSPGKKMNITAGARYDWNSRYGGSFNPRLGIVYQPHTKTTIKLLYGSAFRAPSPSDAYAQYGSFYTNDSGRTYHSNFLHLPNPGLKPVISHTTELNIQQQLCDNVFVSVDGYYTALSGLFVYGDDNETAKLYHNMFYGTPVDYIEVFTNNDRQKTWGGSIQLNWKGDINDVQINSFASLSVVGGKNEAGLKEQDEAVKDIQLDFVSPVMVHAGIDMKWNKFSFAPRLILMGRQHIAGISDTTSAVIKRQTLAGYTLVNISLRYNLSEHFSIYSNMSNALNQRYKNVSFNNDFNNPNNGLYNGQPQDPIRVMAGINFTF
ncbi:MAG: TonB-dependent receptor, partial [Chitinophagaceae bacterium]